MTRPRAADDFAVIRARLEELRRSRGPASAEPGRDRFRRGHITRRAPWRRTPARGLSRRRYSETLPI